MREVVINARGFQARSITRNTVLVWYFLLSGQQVLASYWPGTEGRPLSRAWPGRGWCVSPAGGWGLRWTAPWSWCPPHWNRNTKLIISYNSTTISRKIIAFVAALKAVKVMICTFPSYKRHHAGGSEVINECLGSWTPTFQLLVKLTYFSNFSNLRLKSSKASWLNWIKIGWIQSIIAWTNPCLQQGMFFSQQNQDNTTQGRIFNADQLLLETPLLSIVWCNITEAR